MYPILWKVPGLGWDMPGYGLALMLGFLLSVIWAVRRAERSGADPDVVLNCGFFALFGGVGGARLMYVYHYWDQFAYRRSTLEVLQAIIDVRQGGLEVYGGVITSAVLVLLYLRFTRRSVRWYLDILAPSTALGMALGRVGCFLNGCCFGGVCDLPWTVRFPYGSPAQAQQWADREPGAGLPQQLLVFARDGVFASGTAATPLPREILTSSLGDLEQTHKAFAELQAPLAELQTKLAQATDEREKKRLEGELKAAQRTELSAGAGAGGFGCSSPPVFSARQMELHGLTPVQLRALAKRFPSLPVHPTQVYSTITLGLLAAVLSAVYWRRTRDGQVICTLFVIEPWTRWTLEVLRADNPVDTLGTFTISQFLGICLSVAGLIGLLWLQRTQPRSPQAVLWEPSPETPPSSKSSRKGASSR